MDEMSEKTKVTRVHVAQMCDAIRPVRRVPKPMIKANIIIIMICI